VSYGEDYKPLFSGVLSLSVEKVKGVIKRTGDREECKIYGERVNPDDLPPNSDR